jgi:hypothetical protein
MYNLRFIENIKPVWACEPKNYTGAANTIKYASLKNYERLIILIQTGAWAGGTAAVTLKQATAVAGTGTKALSFTTMWVNTSGAPDTFTKTTVASDTFNLDTANLLYLIEVNASDLDVANSFDCVGVNVATPGANADFYGVVYLAGPARFPQASLPTCLSD